MNEPIAEPQPEKGLKEQIADLNRQMSVLVSEKKFSFKTFKLKWNISRKLKSIAKKSKVLVIPLGLNRNIKPIILKVENGHVLINGVPRNVSTDFVYLWEGKTPTILIKEWDNLPIGTKDYDDFVKAGGDRNAIASKTLINMIESKDYEDKKKGGSGFMIWILGAIGIAVAAWLLFGGTFK